MLEVYWSLPIDSLSSSNLLLINKDKMQNPISKLLSWLIKDNLVNKESNVNILEIKRPSWPDYTKMTWRTEGKKHYGPLFFSSFYAFFQSHFFKILSESYQVQWAHVKILYLTRPKWESYSKITCQIEGKKQFLFSSFKAFSKDNFAKFHLI